MDQEALAALAALEALNLAALAEVRTEEFRAEEAAAPTELEAYWAGSAFASVRRDYRAGRVKTIRR